MAANGRGHATQTASSVCGMPAASGRHAISESALIATRSNQRRGMGDLHMAHRGTGRRRQPHPPTDLPRKCTSPVAVSKQNAGMGLPVVQIRPSRRARASAQPGGRPNSSSSMSRRRRRSRHSRMYAAPSEATPYASSLRACNSSVDLTSRTRIERLSPVVRYTNRPGTQYSIAGYGSGASARLEMTISIPLLFPRAAVACMPAR